MRLVICYVNNPNYYGQMSPPVFVYSDCRLRGTGMADRKKDDVPGMNTRDKSYSEPGRLTHCTRKESRMSKAYRCGTGTTPTNRNITENTMTGNKPRDSQHTNSTTQSTAVCLPTMSERQRLHGRDDAAGSARYGMAGNNEVSHREAMTICQAGNDPVSGEFSLHSSGPVSDERPLASSTMPTNSGYRCACGPFSTSGHAERHPAASSPCPKASPAHETCTSDHNTSSGGSLSLCSDHAGCTTTESSDVSTASQSGPLCACFSNVSIECSDSHQSGHADNSTRKKAKGTSDVGVCQNAMSAAGVGDKSNPRATERKQRRKKSRLGNLDTPESHISHPVEATDQGNYLDFIRKQKFNTTQATEYIQVITSGKTGEK